MSELLREWKKAKSNIVNLNEKDLKKLLKKGRYPNNNTFPPLFKLPNYKYSDKQIIYYSPRVNRVYRQYQIPNKVDYDNLVNKITDLWEAGETHKKNGKTYVAKSVKEILTSPEKIIPVSVLHLNKSNSFRYLDNIYMTQIENWKKYFQNYLYQESSEYEYSTSLDISDFYRQIYTHSVTWAFYGKENGKDFWRKNPTEYNKTKVRGLEKALEKLQDKQTNGIPIGPIASDLVADILLSRITSELENRLLNFQFEYIGCRFKDDMRILTKSRHDTEMIIEIYSEILQEYGLSINHEKLSIEDSFNSLLIQKWKTFVTSLPSLENSNPKSDSLFTVLGAVEEFQKDNKGNIWYQFQDKYKSVLSNHSKDLETRKKLIIWFINNLKRKPDQIGVILNIMFDNLVKDVEDLEYMFEKLSNLWQTNRSLEVSYIWTIYFVASQYHKFKGSQKFKLLFNLIKSQVDRIQNIGVKAEADNLIKYCENQNFPKGQKPLSYYFNSRWYSPSS